MFNLSQKAALVVLIGILYVGGFFWGLSAKVTFAVVNTAEAPVVVSAQNPLAQWLDRLEEAESHDSGDAHLRILDHNDRYSYGCLQFQSATFLQYGKLYNLIPSDLTKAAPLIYNCALQKQLATDMIEGNYQNWKQWYHSAMKVVGLPPHPGEAVVADN